MFSCWGNSSLLMSGDNSTAGMQAIESLLRLVRDVERTSTTGFKGRFKKDCTDLSRRVASLSHLFEEIRDCQANHGPCSSLSFRSSISQLKAALKASRSLLQSADGFNHITSPQRAAIEFTTQFEGVACKLGNALTEFPYGDLEISEDVKEQVHLLRYQLKRATHDGVQKSKVLKSIDSVDIPFDFLCPISREVMRDPVIVSTGQTYERSYIQRWINSGKRICPKTCQKLKNTNLTPNHVLRSLIAQWCEDHDVEQPILPKNKSIVRKPSTQSTTTQEQRPDFRIMLIGLAVAVLYFLCGIIIAFA